MQRKMTEIIAYIEYLRERHALTLSFHFSETVIARIPLALWQQMLPYNTHTGAYCLAVKRQAHHLCLAAQEKIYATPGGEPYLHTCHAGVKEYISPVLHEGQTVGFVAVGGCAADGESTLPTPPPEDACRVLIPPLVCLLECFVSLLPQKAEGEGNLMLHYLHNVGFSLDFDEFCLHFGRSRSYISHMFRRTFGITFSEYRNELRLSEAKRLLLSTDRSVTEIALAVGFEDVSYFIDRFKRKTGLTPLCYRKTGESGYEKRRKEERAWV